MKIKKVDDKPMVIHTKKKAKIHTHDTKAAKIKGSNIYTVERGPKTAGAKATETDKKKTYRRSTIHQSKAKNKGLSRFKRNIREANTSIKTKNTNLHIAGRTGALAAGAVTEQVDGGQEVSQAAYLAYEASRPVTGTASKGAELFRKKAAEQAKKRIKKVEAGRKLAKKSAKKAAKDTAKTVAKETAKTTTKVATKTATKAAAIAAGTAVAPGVGTAVGMAAGVSIEAKDAKATNRSRKIKFFLDKMKAQENQTDSFAKLVKDLVVRKAIMWVKVVAPIIGLVLLLLVLLVAIVAIPVIAVIAILYNSPFALFLPPLESGDSVQTVTSAYVSEFNRDVNTKVNGHAGCDIGELVYVDYEGMEENPSNYYDIMAVYMVKYGVGDTATVMNDKSKGWLQTVVNDMCSYTTSSSRNYDVLGRELFTADEVRKLDNKKCIIFIRGFDPIMDNKFIPFNHPMFNQTADGKGKPYVHQIRGTDNLIGLPFEILSDKAVKYYEKLKDKGENVYIDSLTYEQFMMLGDAELSRRFSMQDEAEQKAKIDREQANELEYVDESQKFDAAESANASNGSAGAKPVRNPEREKPKWEDTITNRMLHWSYTPEQKEEVKKALAAGVPKATILTYFYPEVSVERMSSYRKKH